VTTEWSYKDVPISKFHVTHEINPLTGEIQLITDIAGKITREIIQSKSDQIQNALVSMGWTPPGYRCPFCRGEE
jgi:hypothetical protein